MTLKTSSYRPVWMKGHPNPGTLVLTADSISFYAVGETEPLAQMKRESLTKISFTKATNAFPKVRLITRNNEGTISYLFRFDSRNDLERVRLDLTHDWEHIMDHQSIASLDLTETRRSPHLHDQIALFEGSNDVDVKLEQDVDKEHKQENWKGQEQTSPKKEVFTSEFASNAALSRPNEIVVDLSGKEVASKAKKSDEETARGELPLCSGRWTGCVLVCLMCFVLVNGIIAGFYLSGKDSGSDVVTSADDWYMHDALVASMTLGEPDATLADMIEAASCVATEEEAKRFEDLLPQIVRRAQERFETNKGRIVESTDEAFYISENYEGRLKGVTFACIISYGNNFDKGVGPAAYAGHILAATLDAMPFRKEPDAYNISFLLEADVMEFETISMAYVPRRYCFDFDDEIDEGIAAGSKFSTALPSRVTLDPKIITVGGRTGKHANAENWAL
jgi:hypothetical protein